MKKLALYELVERRTFRTTRHAGDLEDGDLGLIAADDHDFPRFMMLADLKLLYRSTDDASERRKIAAAFEKLANQDDSYLYADLLNGVEWQWDPVTDECVLVRSDQRAYVRPDIARRVGRRVPLERVAPQGRAPSG